MIQSSLTNNSFQSVLHFIQLEYIFTWEQAMTDQRETRSIALLFPYTLHWMGVGGQHHALATLTQERDPVPILKKGEWPQGQSGPVQKTSPPPGLDPWTIQSVANRHSDCVIPAHSVIRHHVFNITLYLLCHGQICIPAEINWITVCHQDSLFNPYFSLNEVSQYLDGCLPHQLRHYLHLKHANISVKSRFSLIHQFGLALSKAQMTPDTWSRSSLLSAVWRNTRQWIMSKITLMFLETEQRYIWNS